MSSIVSPRPVYIYALVDPRTDEVRYIGQSVRPQGRLRDHLGRARRNGHTDVACWLRELLALDMRPMLRLLEFAGVQTCAAAEQRQIAAHLAMGCRLTNLTPGGEGTPGPKTPEHRAKIGASHKGRAWSPEHLAHVRAERATRRGKPMSDAACAKMSETTRRWWATAAPEVRAARTGKRIAARWGTPTGKPRSEDV